MYTNKKVSDSAILVTDNNKSNKMYIRRPGAADRHSELEFLSVEDGKIIINGDVAAAFGLTLIVTGDRSLTMDFSEEPVEERE